MDAPRRPAGLARHRLDRRTRSASRRSSGRSGCRRSRCWSRSSRSRSSVPFLVRDLPAIVRIVLIAAAAAVARDRGVHPRDDRRGAGARSRRSAGSASGSSRGRGGVIGRVPMSRDDAIDWLVAHPKGPIAIADELPIRIEIELLAGRRDEARALARAAPDRHARGRDSSWPRCVTSSTGAPAATATST